MTSRRDFALGIASVAAFPSLLSAGSGRPKVLIVVAHPDDEYMVAATTYRLVRELDWTADQVVITASPDLANLRNAKNLSGMQIK